MPVSVAPPGNKIFNVIPVPSNSCAQIVLINSSAAFDGPYGENPFRFIVPRFIEIFIILPDFCFNICGMTALVIRYVPLIFVFITICQLSAFDSQKGFGSVMNNSFTNNIPLAALFTRTSILPNLLITESTNLLTSPGFVISAKIAVPFIFETVSSISS